MRRITIGLWLCLLALLPIPITAQGSEIPWPTDGWQTTSPEAQGMDANRLATMLDFILQQELDIHSVLVIRNGYLVLEAYRYPYTEDMGHQVYSTTKSVTSALVGIALAQDYIEGLDQPMLDFFPEYTIDNRDEAKESITVENLLTMSSGLDWSSAPLENPSLGELYASADWIQFVLDRPMENEPGERFVYNTGGSHLLAAIVEEAVGQDALTFAQTNLFEPLGIHSANWPTDPQGHNTGGTGLQLTPRDMAKFGYLFLNNGQWDGEQIIPVDYVAGATQEHIASRPYTESYGYQWWVDDLRGFYMTAGYGGQHVMVDPAQNLVVVFTSSLPVEAVQQPKVIFQNLILPAIQSDEPLPENPEGEAALQAILDTFAHPTPHEVEPLPAAAARISGQVYELDANDVGWESVTLRFTDAADTAQVQMGGQPSIEIGLDNLFRVTPMPDSPAIFAKGAWTKDDRFVLRYTFAGTADVLQLTFTFDDQDVKMLLRNDNSGAVYSLEGTAG
jgi:CubicO group peptidase (beta-lactamase class C family)